ncbi:MAG: DNA integrity scanning diadenylate cyclase DisA [Bacillota bacterium]
MDGSEERFLKTLRTVAPGTPLREGLENILRARTGALIVVGDSDEVMEIVDGGFRIDAEFTPTQVYELAKMDGAIILSRDARRIMHANVQLVPDATIPSFETGIRHRTAERVAKQTGELVISISQRRNVITLYKGPTKYTLKDIGVILSKANQAIQTLERYKSVLDQSLANLSYMEFEDLATLNDVATVIQRTEMVLRVVKEIEKYISELGIEGRLVSMQLNELVSNVPEEGLAVIRDYIPKATVGDLEKAEERISKLSSEELLDLDVIARELGFGAGVDVLEQSVTPRGYRLLKKIPRLPLAVIENLAEHFGSFQQTLTASIEELDAVEGIGEIRARSIKDGLRRLREQVLLDRHF